MKNKQKQRRSYAWILSVLLCIITVIPVLVISSGADTQTTPGETVNTVPLDYVIIQWDYEEYPDRSFYYELESDEEDEGGYENTWSINTPFYLETLYDEALTTKFFNGTLSMTLRFSYDSGNFEFQGTNIVSFGFGSDAPDISCEGAGMDAEPEFLRLYIPASVLDSVRYFAVLSGGQITVPDSNSAYQTGYDIGYTAAEKAHADDYKNGFSAGQTDAMNSTSSLKDLIFGIFSAPGELINGILDFNLFGINLASLVKTLITLTVVALITVFLFKLMKR